MQKRALEAALDQAEEANTAKTQFLANVSHELRTPLNAIIGFSEILTEEVFGSIGSERNKEYIGLIHNSGAHLLQVVNDILDMSKIEAGKFDVVAEPFDIKDMIATTCAIMEPAARDRKVVISHAVAPDLMMLNADHRACRQILLNLVSNGVKFSNDGGRVHVNARRKGAGVELTVEDTGIGIAKDDMDRVGQPFVQLDNAFDRRHEGTGLGLSVVRGLVELHGGRLTIESSLGVGTTMRVYLPSPDLPDTPDIEGPCVSAAPARTATREAPPAPAPEPARAQGRVDDRPADIFEDSVVRELKALSGNGRSERLSA